MQTLDEYVYEFKQDSKWYQGKVKEREGIKDFFNKINNEYFEDNGFSFYHEEHFGVQGYSEDYEKFKNEVKKNPDKNGVHIFKKRSKYYSIFKDMLKEINIISPFMAHDVLGSNNMRASQWLGDRWFWEVKNPDAIKSDQVEPVVYKEYLEVVKDSIDK